MNRVRLNDAALLQGMRWSETTILLQGLPHICGDVCAGKKGHSYIGLPFRAAKGCSTSLGLHPTKLPMMWEVRVATLWCTCM